VFSDSIRDYVEGVAAKYLTAVDANPKKSNQHEIGGLPSAGFKRHLGEPAKGEKLYLKGRLVYVSDNDDAPLIVDDELTWYGATRSGDPKRAPEYRLYYKTNAVTSLFAEGDFFLIAKLRDDTLLLIFTPQGSTIEAQLRVLFGIDEVGNTLRSGSLKGPDLLLPLRLLLEDLGLVADRHQSDEVDWLARLIDRFGHERFPSTIQFSAFARETLQGAFDPSADPDAALMAWMDHEEHLFRVFERHLVSRRLHTGFGEDGGDVDAFISFSLSVQNRRKSRVGHAFEGHLETLFEANKLRFERARGKERVTENNSKPDFLFPGFKQYHDLGYPAERLLMLGAKTTCKDRWRQVLAEAKRISRKHLVTLEPAISRQQTSEMKASGVQLVIPAPLHETFAADQQAELSSIAEFIDEVRRIEA